MSLSPKKFHVRPRVLFLAIVILFIVGFFFRYQILSALPLDKMGYAAIVNGEPILLSDIIEDGTPKQTLLEQSILQKLLLQEAKKLRVTVSDDEITLAAASMNLSMRDTFVLLGTPSSKEQFRTQLIIAKYLNQTILKDIIVTPTEPKEYYDKNPSEFILPQSVHIAHILVRSTGLELDETLQTIVNSITKGVPFEELAARYSEDIASARFGGDLGYVYKGQLPPEFEKIIFALPLGGISTTFKTRYGFHIAKLYDKKPSRQLLYEEVQDKLPLTLLAKKQKEAFIEHTNKLKQQSYISIYLKPINSLANVTEATEI